MPHPASHREDQDADWVFERATVAVRSITAEQMGRGYGVLFPESGNGIVAMTNAIGGNELKNAMVDQWQRKSSRGDGKSLRAIQLDFCVKGQSPVVASRIAAQCIQQASFDRVL